MLENKVNIQLYQPVRASAPEFVEEVQKLKADFFVVISYGELMKQNLLDVPKVMCINIHPSLLPKYRGPSPIQSVLLEGEKESGVTIMEMVLAMDAGPILAQEKVPLSIDTTYGELEELLIDKAKELLKDVLNRINGKKIAQDESKVTLTKKITSEDVWINWKKSALEVHNFVRALSPKPGAKTAIEVHGKKQVLKIFRTRFIPGEGSTTLSIKEYNPKEKWVLSLPGGCLEILEVQPENKRIMSAKDFMNGCSSLSITI